MTKIYTRLLSALLLFLITGFYSQIVSAQSYYSNFPVANSTNYFIVQPGGAECLAPPVMQGSNIADSSLSNYAVIADSVNIPLLCDAPFYKFNAKLNTPGGLLVPAGYATGFKVKISSTFNVFVLGANVAINTYIDDVLIESKSDSSLSGLDVLANTAASYIYFYASKPFNRVELVINDAITHIGVKFEGNIYYAFATPDNPFPATISNFSASLTGNNRVALSWQALTETNVSHYVIERSADGIAFNPVATLQARGNGSSRTAYSYTDQVISNGNYLYRLRVFDKDGASVTTNYVSVSIKGNAIAVYPSVLRAGQILNIKTTVTGSMININVYNIQGRLVQHEYKATNGTAAISTSSLKPGTYILKVMATDGSMFTSKFIIN